MNACQARLHPQMVNGPAGWPEYDYGGVCRQSVGVRSWWDALNIERRYCAKPGHPYDKANTYLWHGERQCRECLRTKKRERRAGAAWMDAGVWGSFLMGSPFKRAMFTVAVLVKVESSSPWQERV